MKITSALDNVISSLQFVDDGINDAFDTNKIYAARNSLDMANAELIEMNENLNKVNNNQNKHKKTVEESEDAMNSLSDSVMGLVGAYVGLAGVSKLVTLSDEMALSAARLNNIVTEQESVVELQDKIFASAQRSRGAYQDMLDIVAKLGTQAKKSFSSNDEIIAFAETLNKSFILGGSDSTAQAAAMYQLTQAMSSGRLQGDEYRSIIENAPMLAQAIEDYMRNVQGATGSMKEWASEGLLTANVIKAAVFNASEEINSKFAEMPMTWSQVWTKTMNSLIKASQPLLDFINVLANNWSIIAPIVLGVASSLLYYLMVTKGVEAATRMWAAAQALLNGIMALNPVSIVIMAILVLVGLIAGAVAAINKFTDANISAAGVIVGVLTSAVAFIWNLFIGLLDLMLAIVNYMMNPWVAFANFIGNLFTDPIGAIIRAFGDMADIVLGILESIAKAIDAVFGSSLADTVSGWRTGLDAKVEEFANRHGNGAYEKIVDEINLDSTSLGLDRWAYGDAWDSGYKLGESIGDGIGDIFGDGALNNYTYDELMKGIGNIDDNTSSIADSMDITSEDLKYLMDLAERDAINRFTTAEIRIEQTNNNNINSEMDIDGVVDRLTTGVTDAIEKVAEGVHK